MLSKTIVDSPIGPLWLFANDDALVAIEIPERSTGLEAMTNDRHPVLAQSRRWLSAYFAGKPLPEMPKLAPEGTPFQQGVWRAMLAIAPGKTLSYGAIAKALNRPNGARAVGMACGRNPIPVIIPCHRVIGTSGALTGFGWGMPRKVWLLAHEGFLPKTLALDQAASS